MNPIFALVLLYGMITVIVVSAYYAFIHPMTRERPKRAPAKRRGGS